MSTLTIRPSGKTVEVKQGDNILQVLTAAGEPVKPNAGASLHIFVQEGRKSLSKITPEENATLDTIVGVGSKSRLADKLTVTGDENITIELLGEFSGM